MLAELMYENQKTRNAICPTNRNSCKPASTKRRSDNEIKEAERFVQTSRFKFVLKEILEWEIGEDKRITKYLNEHNFIVARIWP